MPSHLYILPDVMRKRNIYLPQLFLNTKALTLFSEWGSEQFHFSYQKREVEITFPRRNKINFVSRNFVCADLLYDIL